MPSTLCRHGLAAYRGGALPSCWASHRSKELFMMHRAMTCTLKVVVVSATLAALIAGCSPPTDSSAPSSATEPGTTDRPVLTSSPLDDYLPLTDGMSEEAREVTRVAQAFIAQCLKDQGFDYDEPYLSDQAIRDGEGLSPTEWAAAYGFGFATSAGGGSAAPAIEPRSPAEQQAYLEALYGPEPTDVAEDEGPVYDWTTQGCLGSAYHEATGGIDALYGDADHDLVLGEIDALADAVLIDSRVQDVDQAWSDCMADEGFADLASPAAAADRALRWWQAVAGAESEVDGIDVAGESGDDPAEPSSSEDPADREIALAVVDIECQLSVGHAATVQQVRWQHEQELVETYPRELAALRDAAGSLS